MLEECSFFCVTASRSVSSYSLMFLSSLWLSVNETGHGKTFHVDQGNFITDAGEWVFFLRDILHRKFNEIHKVTKLFL